MSNHHLFLKAGFINVPLKNGVGRYVCQLQRVVLKFCKNNGSSRGMREFIESDLVKFAKDNPGIVVYLKPRRHRTAVMKGEYLNGDTHWMSCRNFTREEVSKWFELLKTQQGNHIGSRVRKLWKTDYPSIQGPWTPFTFRDPKLNLCKFPDAELTQPDKLCKSSYEELIELFNNQKLLEENVKNVVVN